MSLIAGAQVVATLRNLQREVRVNGMTELAYELLEHAIAMHRRYKEDGPDYDKSKTVEQFCVQTSRRSAE